MRENPLLSIVIPCYNEEKDIGECLESLGKQTYSNFELIIIDDGSKDKTIEKIKGSQRSNKKIKIKILQQEHKGPGEARNLGAKNSKGEILIFVDSDMTFDKDYLKFLIKPIIEQNVVGTENEIQISSNYETNIWSKCWGKFFFDGKNKNRKIFRAIKRDKFLELGGFDSKYGYGDDQTFYRRDRIKPVIAKGAICYHKGPSTLKEVYRQSSWISSSYDSFLFKVPIIKYLIPVVLVLVFPLAFVLAYFYKLLKSRDITLIIPMISFVIARYLGIINGLFNKIYLKNNAR